MERKCIIMKRVPLTLVVFGLCLTLLFCSCNSGQAIYQEQRTPKQRERSLKILRLYIKAKQRVYCLSADIKTASDTNRCFNCHDNIER